ncbi:hypothetical protein JCM24511_06134 [Saitozyma sp. JCM 24511]|nr:hypothetical protein JCM24511_06134 [Saitozyma sp. JCM 24511]
MPLPSSSKPSPLSTSLQEPLATTLLKPCPSPSISLSLSALPVLPSGYIKPPYPGSGTPSDPYLIDWLPDEPANPCNWSSSRRWIYTLIVAFSCLCIAFASTSYSAAVKDIIKAYPGTTQETAIAGIRLYVLGFGIGPLIWAPISELYGRNVAFNASYPIFVLFNMAGALSKNIPSILVFRLLAGSFGSAPLTNAGGSNRWSAHERAMATSIFSFAPFLGPVVGPIVGGFIAENCSYRVVFWVQFAFGAVMCLSTIFIVPETFAPTLLRRKAKQLQKEADEVKKTKFEILRVGLSRPFAMLGRELIVFCLCLYAAIVYGTLYLFFTAFPIVFQQNRGWTGGTGGLAFLGIGVGLLIGNALQPLGSIW